jgi:hypothetical protein
MPGSPASLLAAYGDCGRGVSSSWSGYWSWSPYTEDDEANTTRASQCRAASSTFMVPIAFTPMLGAG